MCGIAGFTNPGKDARAVVGAMAAVMAHRGPDGQGAHVDDNIAMGHRRLAVIDPDGGDQPRVDGESGDALVFNGEIYGYKDLADELRAAGVPLRDRSDTEVLFWMVRRHGVQGALERVDGMFAFAFREGKSGRLYLVRDRFGEKPLFYGISGGALVFASEIKAMVRHPAFQGAGLDADAVYRYLTFEYLPGGESGLAGIGKLRPGHMLVFEDGQAREEAYWRPRYGGADPAMSENEALDRLEELLSDSVARRLIADVPVGLFLSGGVDSSLIAAMAARHSSDITAYTVRMGEASYDETPYARSVAGHLGMKHEVVELSNSDVSGAFDAISASIDEPLADYSMLPTYMVCKAARRSMTVALGGDGGDELFAGYSTFRARRYSALMACLPAALGAAVRRGLDCLPASEGYMSPGFVLRYVSQGFGHSPDRQPYLWMAPFTQGEKARLWRREALPAQTGVFAPIDEWLDQGAPSDPMERLLYLFTVTYLAEDILAKVDRASMMNSLEVRAPFLDRAFAEFALSLPSRCKINGTKTKYLLKKLAARHVPRETVYRPKHGFGLPLSDLLRGPLYEPVSGVLMDSDNPAAGWFDRNVIEGYLKEHKEERRDHRKKLWTLYVLFKVAGRGP
ncbi:MAG: asparagine synthase (glutamine-hydrolyzing) [Rhodospirillales bacterium]